MEAVALPCGDSSRESASWSARTNEQHSEGPALWGTPEGALPGGQDWGQGRVGSADRRGRVRRFVPGGRPAPPRRARRARNRTAAPSFGRSSGTRYPMDRRTGGLRSRLRRFDPACARVAHLARSAHAIAGPWAASRRRGSPYALPALAGPAVPAVGRDRALRSRNAHELPAPESGLAVVVQAAFLALAENAHLPEPRLLRAVGAGRAPSVVPLAGMTPGQRQDGHSGNDHPDGTAHGFSLEKLGQSSGGDVSLHLQR